MSGAYIKGVSENLAEAEITFDKFHAVKLVNDAVDQVRRAESREVWGRGFGLTRLARVS
jgi:transposase